VCREEHLDRIALVGAVAASTGVEVVAYFKRIKLRVADIDRPAMEAPALPPAKCLHPWCRSATLVVDLSHRKTSPFRCGQGRRRKLMRIGSLIREVVAFFNSDSVGITALALNPMTLINAPAGTEIILLELVALFLTVATMWILLYAIEAFTPDDFWIVILLIIPFVMLIYFGSAIIICSEMAARSGPPLPLELSLRKVVPMAVTYIGLTVWLWLRWHKLVVPQR
jgi:hypothetical protein